jgi:trk system potassium uptake protein TrkH
MAMTLLIKPKNRVIYAKEGFVIVAFAWLLLSGIGALPFVISGEIPSYIDAFFETVSGFTTTGASILTNVEKMSHGLLFWRSFTHWIGGMGVLVFIMAVVPSAADRSIHILRAEVPGPTVGKLVPRMKDTAKILYLLYIVLTVLEIILLLAGGMPLFDSIVHAFGTAGTGGFGIKANSIAGYNHYLQWVITIFMLLFGINFNLFYLMLLRRFKAAFHSSELWCYMGIWVVATLVVTFNVMQLYESFSESLRLAAFQTASIMTTTGYATADFNLWPNLSKGILVVLMCIGACAGSTAGGLKISRVMLLMKMIRRELRHMLHPRSVGVVKFEGKKVDNQTLSSVNAYFAIYVVISAIIFLLLCIDGFDLETNLTAMIACFNNIGPGLGRVGPAASFAGYSVLSKLVLSFAMLLGRLEIFPLLFAVIPSTWMKK